MPIAQTRLETLQICKLLQCVREEDREQIEKLTINGVPHLVNYNEPLDGETALNMAAMANNDTMIQFLLDLGAHPDVVDFKGRSAVMRAVQYGHVQCLEKLAKKGADMKLCDLQGNGECDTENVGVVMMPTLWSLVAQQVVVMTTCGATSDDKVDIMTNLGFQWKKACKINNGTAMMINISLFVHKQ